MRPGIGGVFDLTSLPVVGTFDHSPSPGGGLTFSLQPLVDWALPAPSWISTILDDQQVASFSFTGSMMPSSSIFSAPPPPWRAMRSALGVPSGIQASFYL